MNKARVPDLEIECETPRIAPEHALNPAERERLIRALTTVSATESRVALGDDSCKKGNNLTENKLADYYSEWS